MTDPTTDPRAAARRALLALVAAGEDAIAHTDYDDMVDVAGDDLAVVVAAGPVGLAALLKLLDIAVDYAAAVSGESASFVARAIVEVDQHGELGS